jgi:predicted CxxxxCH...CXXCH cytochrome family protein
MDQGSSPTSRGILLSPRAGSRALPDHTEVTAMRSVRLGTLAAAAAVFIVGCDEARPLEQRAEAGVCERCHGFPPPAPHPQLAACSACHGSTVAEGTVIIEGGTHLNGRVDVTEHPVPYVAHSREALARADEPLGQPLLSACTPCHGGDLAGGTAGVSCNDCHASLQPIAFRDWQTNCTFCHGTRSAGSTGTTPLAAPPQTVIGAADPGAHQQHLAGGTVAKRFSNGVACTECHPNVEEPGGPLLGIDEPLLGHANGDVELAFGPLARANGAAATFDRQTASCTNYCHGATLPPSDPPRPAVTWAPRALDCGSCHEANPTTGRHPAVSAGHATFDCSTCHGGIYTATAADPAFHVNGTLDLHPRTGFTPGTPPSCTAVCHPPVRSWQ